MYLWWYSIDGWCPKTRADIATCILTIKNFEIGGWRVRFGYDTALIYDSNRSTNLITTVVNDGIVLAHKNNWSNLSQMHHANIFEKDIVWEEVFAETVVAPYYRLIIPFRKRYDATWIKEGF